VKTLESGRFVALAAAVSIGILLVMVLGTLPHLQQMAGGLTPFDLRPNGYTAEEAQALLAALGTAGRDFYLNVQLRIDLIYPASHFVSRAALLWWLTKPGRIARAPIALPLRAVLLMVPFVVMIADYAENQGIAAMLHAQTPDAGLVMRTSLETQIKSLASFVTELAVILLGSAALVRWARIRRTA
jgi:hypothetical protein